MANALDILSLYKSDQASKAGYLQKGAQLDDAVTDLEKKQRRISAFAPTATLAIEDYEDPTTAAGKRIAPTVADFRAEDERVNQLANMPQYEAGGESKTAFGTSPIIDVDKMNRDWANASASVNQTFFAAEPVEGENVGYEPPWEERPDIKAVQKIGIPILRYINSAREKLEAAPGVIAEDIPIGAANMAASFASYFEGFAIDQIRTITGEKVDRELAKIQGKEWTKDPNFAEKVVTEANQMVQDWNKSVQLGHTYDNDPHKAFDQSVLRSLMSQTVGLSAAIATKNPMPLFALMYAEVKGAERQRLIDKGYTHEQAEGFAQFKGAVNVLFELFPGSKLFNMSMGKQFAKNAAEFAISEPFTEVATTIMENASEAITDGLKTPEEYKDDLVNTYVQTLVNVGVMPFVAGGISGINKSRQYTPVAKAAVKELYAGLNENLKSGITSEGFTKNVVRTGQDSWDFFKKGVKLVNKLNEVLGERGSISGRKIKPGAKFLEVDGKKKLYYSDKDQVWVKPAGELNKPLEKEPHDLEAYYNNLLEDKPDKFFFKNPEGWYKVSLSDMAASLVKNIESGVLDDSVKARINYEYGTDLSLDDPIEKYYEKLFGTKVSRVDAFKHFLGEDYGAARDIFDRYANRYSLNEQLKFEKLNVDHYFESDDMYVTSDPQGVPYDQWVEKFGGLPIVGSFMVKRQRNDGKWSQQKEVEIIQKMGNQVLVRFNDTIQPLEMDRLSIVREVNADNLFVGAGNELFDTGPMTPSRIQKNPSDLFVIANENEAKKYPNAVSFKTEMTDENYHDNMMHILDVLNRVQRAVGKKTIVAERTIKKNSMNVVNRLKAGKPSYINDVGLDIGDVVEIVPDGGEPIFARVTKEDPGRWVWSNGGYRPTTSEAGLIRYTVEPVIGGVVSNYTNVIIPQGIARSLQEKAPRTYAGLIQHLAEFKRYMNNRRVASERQSNVIWKDVPENEQKVYTTVYGSLGGKTGYSYVTEKPNTPATIIKEVAVLKDGKSVYLTDLGFLDKDGREYIFDQKDIYNYATEYVAIDDTGLLLLATGNTYQEVADKIAGKKGSIQSFKDYLDELKGRVTNVALYNYAKTMDAAKEKYSRVWELLNNPDVLRTMKVYGYSGYRKPKEQGFAKTEFGAIFLKMDGKNLAETLTHEAIHVFVDLAIMKDPNLRAKVQDLKFKFMLDEVYAEMEANAKLAGEEEKFEEFKKIVLTPQEFLSYFLTTPSLVAAAAKVMDGDRTLHESALVVLEEAVNINTKIREQAAKQTIYEYKQPLHKPIWAIHKPAPWEDKIYKFGINFYKAIKEGEKTSMIVKSEDVRDLEVGQVIDIVGGSADGGVTVKVTRIDRGLNSLLKIHQETNDRTGATYWTSSNKELLEDISRTEGLTDFIPSLKGTQTPYGTGFVIKGSGATNMFSPDNPNAFWRNKQATRVVFEVVNKTQKKQKFTWGKENDNGYEVSTQGDKRFSALVAKLQDGRTIEEAYQLDLKGYRILGNDWRHGKRKAPLEGSPLYGKSKEETYKMYRALWEQWASENTDLIEELRSKAAGKVLTDQYATTDVSQARALADILNGITTSKPVEKDKRNPQDFTVKFEETENDKKIRFVYTKFNDALAAGDIKTAKAIANWAVLQKVVSEEDLERIIVQWEADRAEPAFSTLFDYATDRGMWIAFAKESYQSKPPMDTQTATGMGVEGGGFQKGRKAAPIGRFENTNFLGDSYTGTIATSGGYFEATITGTGFNSIAIRHLNSVIEQIGLWIDLRGLRGLDPTSAIAQSHFSIYPELRDMFKEYYKQGQELKAINDRIVKQTFNKMGEIDINTYSEDIEGEEGYTQKTNTVGREVLSKAMKEKTLGETDESTVNQELIDNLTEAKSLIDISGITFDDLKKFRNLIRKQISKIPVAREFIEFMSNEGGAIEIPYHIPDVVRKYIDSKVAPRDENGLIPNWFYHSISKALKSDQIDMKHPVVEEVIKDIPESEAAKIVFDYFGYPRNNTFENELRNQKVTKKDPFSVRFFKIGNEVQLSVYDELIYEELYTGNEPYIPLDKEVMENKLRQLISDYAQGLPEFKVNLSEFEKAWNFIDDATSHTADTTFKIYLEHETAGDLRSVTPEVVKKWKARNHINYNPMDIKKAGYRLVHQIGKYASVDIGQMLDSMISGEMFISETGAGIPVQISALTTKTLRPGDRYIEFIPENMTPEDIIIVGEHDLYTNFPNKERGEFYRLPRADKATYVKRSFQYLKKNVRDTWGHDEIVVNLRPGNFRLVGDFERGGQSLKFTKKPKELEELMKVATSIHHYSLDETQAPFVPVSVGVHAWHTVTEDTSVNPHEATDFEYQILRYPITINGVQYMAEEVPDTGEHIADAAIWEFDIRNLETGNIEQRIGMIEYELDFEETNDYGETVTVLTQEAIRRNLEYKLQQQYNTKQKAGKVVLSVFNVTLEYDISSRYGAYFVGNDGLGVRREKLFDHIHNVAFDNFKHVIYRGHNYVYMNDAGTIRWIYEYTNNGFPEIKKIGSSLLSDTAQDSIARLHNELYPREANHTVKTINSWANKGVFPFWKQQMDRMGFKLDLARVMRNERGSSQLLSIIPRMIANFIKRLSTKTKASPDVVSDQLKKLLNVTQKIKMDVPKLLKEAEFFNQSPEDYITGILVNNGLPETTTDGSMSARGMARMIMKDIIDEDVTKIIQKDVEDFTYNEALQRTQEYSVGDRVKDQAYRIKEKTKRKIDQKADSLFEFLKSLTFFPNTPEEFKLKIEKLIADIKGLQTKSSKIHDSIWKNIDNYKHRALMTRLLALEDELKRARKELVTFPGSVNRLWNPNIEGDMSANDPDVAFGTPQVSPKKFMRTIAKNPDGTLQISMAHRAAARKEMIRMSLEAGLTPKQADLMLKEEDRIPQIVNQILGLHWGTRTLADGTKESYPIASELIIRVQPNGEKYLEHFKHNQLVNPVQLTNIIDVEEATRIIKKNMEAQLKRIRKYNKKYFEPMFAIRVNNVEIGAIGREYDKIMDEYNQALAEFNALPAAIQKNLHSVRNNWRIWTSHLLSHLKQLGWIDENAGWDEYVPYFVNADWSMKRWMGLPKKLKEQPAFYTSKAYGTARARMLEPEFLVDHILNVQYDIIVSTHIDSIARDLDAAHFLTEKEMEQFYKYDAHGNLHEFAKTGQVFPLEEDRKDADGNTVMRAGNYIFWTPEYFKFSLGTNEDGDTVILDNVRSYLLEENVAKSLNSIALPYNSIMEKVNTVVNMWKKTLIYTIYPAFNFANMLGDLQMYAFLHPAATQSLRYLPKTIKFLIKYAKDLKGKEVKFSPFEAKLKAFIDNHNVIEASEMRADLGQRDVTNFFKFLASKMANFAMWREAILRANNAYYLMTEEENGNVDKLKKQFGFLGVDQNIGDMNYLGRVAKEFMIDYFRRSPAYQRWITGFLFPWAHFYLHGSKNVGNWMIAKGETSIPKRILKAASRISLLEMPPAVASLWNYGLLAMLGGDEDKARKLYEAEMSLTPEMRNRFHIILGWDNGKLKVYCPQYLPDLLIGTKFISVFNNQFFRMMAGEMGPKEAVKTALSDWAKTEVKSAAFLVNPLARFFTGFATQHDPLDGSPIFPAHMSQLDTAQVLGYLGLYFNKVCNPILSTYITEYQKKEMTHSNAMIEALKRFGHYQNILGVKENERKIINVVPTNRENLMLQRPGERNITREIEAKKKEIEIKEATGFRDLADMWIRSGMSPEKFGNDKAVKDRITKMYKDVYKGTMSDEQWDSFLKRANNIFKDPDNNIKWAENNMRRYKPGSKQYKENENFKLSIQQWLKETQRGTPKTIKGETPELINDIVEEGDE